MNARLLASEACLRNVIEHRPDAFIIVDHDGMVQFANSTAAAMFGIRNAALVGRPCGHPMVDSVIALAHALGLAA